jgi:glycosyltransferase involved in cell wall biosynthesis
MHGLPLMTASGLKRLLLRCSESVACLLAHQVLCVSQSVREVAISDRLCPARKIGVLLAGSINGVDALKRFNPQAVGAHERSRVRTELSIPEDATLIGFVGRVVRDKGIVELSEAWKILRGQFPDLHLMVVGPYEPEDPIPAEVETVLGNDPRVHLTGERQVWSTLNAT